MSPGYFESPGAKQCFIRKCTYFYMWPEDPTVTLVFCAIDRCGGGYCYGRGGLATILHD